jgi:putative addiction module component (TIGR02574 family)
MYNRSGYGGLRVIKLTPEDIASMTVAERLELAELIWESMSDRPDQIPLPDWHKSIIEDRLAAYEKDPSAVMTWEQIESGIRSRDK